jgi:hypothetical protein
MNALCEGLQTVALAHDAPHAAEGRVLLAWLKERIGQCGSNRADFTLAQLPMNSRHSFTLKFTYAGRKKNFSWYGNLAPGTALFEANFGTGQTSLSAAVSLLTPEAALSEAMFF